MIYPMLLHKAPNNIASDSDHYINELKLDGIRLIAINDGIQRFYTRHGTEVSKRFPELASCNVPQGCVLDGELISMDQEGKPDFESVMRQFSGGISGRIQYVVFDIIKYNNEFITHLPLIERKAILNQAIENNSIMIKIEYTTGFGDQLFNLVKGKNLEGIVQKKKDSRYEIAKRSHNWLKVINWQTGTFLIAGIRKKEFGWLLLFEDGRYAGVVEFVPANERRVIYSLVDQLKTEESKEYMYLDPIIKAEVKYRNLTSKGLLRIPVFVKFIFE